MLKVFALFVILTFLHPLNGISQHKQTVDSLKSLLIHTHNAEQKIDLYFSLSLEYRSIDIDTSYKYAVRALNLSKKINSKDLFGKIYGNLGDIAIARDSIDKAKSWYESALMIYEEQSNQDGIISILTILGNIAFSRDDYSKTLQLYQRGIVLAENGNYTKRLEILYLNVGAVLAGSGQYNESQEYFSKALIAFQELGDSLEIANVYSNLGFIYRKLDDYSIAKEYYSMALEIYKAKNASIRVASVVLNLAVISFQNGEYRKSINQLKESQSLIDQNNPAKFEGPKKNTLTHVYVQLGASYLALNKTDSAFYFLYRGLRSGLENRQLERVEEAAKFLSKNWTLQGNSDSALYYHTIFKSYSDSLYEEINSRKFAYQEAKFLFEQRAIQDQQQRLRDAEIQKRNYTILIVAIVIMALVLVLLVLLLRLNKIRIKDIEIEKQNLNKELDLKNKELTTYLIYQVKNNEFVLSISVKLKKLLGKTTPDNKTLINEIIREIETDSSSDNWDEFIVRFQQVHTSFYQTLGKNYPDLTSNELRLCAFLKLNMNTKDIAAITYQNTKSITVARWRLRQKLGLKKEEKLAAFLSQF